MRETPCAPVGHAGRALTRPRPDRPCSSRILEREEKGRTGRPRARTLRAPGAHTARLGTSQDVQPAIKGLESFLAVREHIMLYFQCSPKPAHLCTAFLYKIRNIFELQERDFLKKMNRLPWGDAYKTYETLRDECDTLLEEIRLEKQSKQLDQLCENGSVSTDIAATSEEKKLLPCFYLRNEKPCPNGVSYAYSHKKEVIDKTKKTREEWLVNKGNNKDKCKNKHKIKDKDKYKHKRKWKDNICPNFNDKGYNYGSAYKMLHEAPTIDAHISVPKAKAAREIVSSR